MHSMLACIDNWIIVPPTIFFFFFFLPIIIVQYTGGTVNYTDVYFTIKKNILNAVTARNTATSGHMSTWCIISNAPTGTALEKARSQRRSIISTFASPVFRSFLRSRQPKPTYNKLYRRKSRRRCAPHAPLAWDTAVCVWLSPRNDDSCRMIFVPERPKAKFPTYTFHTSVTPKIWIPELVLSTKKKKKQKKQ